MKAPVELYDDRDSVGVMCMRCGLNRRPKRKNRAEVASAAERLGQQGETRRCLPIIIFVACAIRPTGTQRKPDCGIIFLKS